MDQEMQYTAFFDLMGFADGQESLVDEDAQGLARVISGEWLLHPDLSDEAKLLYVRYSNFHAKFEEAAREVAEDLTLKVSFSDSGFIAAPSRASVLRASTKMIQSCFLDCIPIRVGIGRGTVGTAASSIALTSGRLSVQSQFFGTGVVRAYRAQNCDTKGFRVFLHSSAELVEDERRAWLLPRLEQREHSANCVRELNFMYRGGGGDDHDWLYLRRALDRMREGVTSTRALEHYDASAKALQKFEGLLLAQFGADETVLRVDL